MKARNMESLKDKFKNVIVKTPSSSMVDGITSAPELGKPIYELSRNYFISTWIYMINL